MFQQHGYIHLCMIDSKLCISIIIHHACVHVVVIKDGRIICDKRLMMMDRFDSEYGQMKQLTWMMICPEHGYTRCGRS